MAKITVAQVAETLEQLRAQVEALSRRIEALEPRSSPATPAAKAAAPAPTEPGITEEELLAVSAALAAYFGVRPHIRQIRLLSSTAWAQQGRVSIQASHRLQG